MRKLPYRRSASVSIETGFRWSMEQKDVWHVYSDQSGFTKAEWTKLTGKERETVLRGLALMASWN